MSQSGSPATNLKNLLEGNRLLQAALHRQLICVRQELAALQYVGNGLGWVHATDEKAARRRVLRTTGKRGRSVTSDLCYLDSHEPSHLSGECKIQDPFRDAGLYSRRSVAMASFATLPPTRTSVAVSSLKVVYPPLPRSSTTGHTGLSDEKAVRIRAFAAGVTYPTSTKGRVRVTDGSTSPRDFHDFLRSKDGAGRLALSQNWSDPYTLVASATTAMMFERSVTAFRADRLVQLLHLFHLPKWNHLQEIAESHAYSFVPHCEDKDLIAGNDWVGQRLRVWMVCKDCAAAKIQYLMCLFAISLQAMGHADANYYSSVVAILSIGADGNDLPVDRLEVIVASLRQCL